MSDPAVEAAARAWEWYPVPKDIPLVVRSVPLAAAREALKPIRHKHRPVAYVNRQTCCVTCFDENGKPHLWPCETAKLIYTSEELQ
ncbi:hypothetical protein PBI_PMC_49 [Mycobacterium phage PMC]|uniref:Uncharacterized protein n=2 Tax=Cheoctovirus TaxID=1623281 RepID=Q19YK4_9CAUD|nr:hypothetical protein BOOMER_57 [Mycobacterium phage Boomer]YP_655810.1 gp49 [Mycobacterium phage PMC]ABE67550.1 hypothetical protein PBI_PMC_49 [Mycobacterium phage PMC]ACF34119.1 hypothetical protein BOOMER_57 [Mycobacterium phage Boomer]UVK61650.1 hypothetical protein SEA_ROCKNE_53 [Mycobacterium phage Rockne]